MKRLSHASVRLEVRILSSRVLLLQRYRLSGRHRAFSLLYLLLLKLVNRFLLLIEAA